jgi:hypothetical protein
MVPILAFVSSRPNCWRSCETDVLSIRSKYPIEILWSFPPRLKAAPCFCNSETAILVLVAGWLSAVGERTYQALLGTMKVEHAAAGIKSAWIRWHPNGDVADYKKYNLLRIPPGGAATSLLHLTQ